MKNEKETIVLGIERKQCQTFYNGNIFDSIQVKIKLMKYIVLFAFILCQLKVNCQAVNNEFVIGTWKVVKVMQLKSSEDDVKQKYKPLEKVFLAARFKIKESEHFDFEFDLPDMAIYNAHWKLDSRKDKITVQEWKDKDGRKGKLMEFTVLINEDKTYFQLTEVPFLLEVSKQ